MLQQALAFGGMKVAAEQPEWRYGVFYYDSSNPKVWVPKRFGLGWTLNFAHSESYALLGFLLAYTGAMWLRGRAVAKGTLARKDAYRLFFFYYDPANPNSFVPRRRWGYTLNFARGEAWAWMGGLAAFFATTVRR